MRILNFLGGMHLLMDEKKDGDGGGGDSAKAIADLTASNAALMARLDKMEAGSKDKTKTDDGKDKGNDDDLAEKARKDAVAKESKKNDSASLESALKFILGSKEWLKTNASMLPKEVEGIFTTADKESYDDQIQKASAVKSGVVQSFFKIQDNLDLLTGAQKTALEDWLKLTKNGREEKAQSIFDTIFEPTFEMLKRVKKAQQLNTDGKRADADGENAYKQKLINGSRKHYMGEKSNA